MIRTSCSACIRLRDDAAAPWLCAYHRTEIVCEFHFLPEEMAKPGFQADHRVLDRNQPRRLVDRRAAVAGGNQLAGRSSPVLYSTRESLLWSFDEIAR